MSPHPTQLNGAASRRVVAIDLGSSNTVAAIGAGDQVHLVEFDELAAPAAPGQPRLIPSVVYVKDARTVDLLVGDQVRRAGLDRPGDPRHIAGFKRRIAAAMQGLNAELDGLEVGPERIAGWFLSTVLDHLPDLDRDRDTVVFTVPVGSFQRYLAWLESFWPVRHWRVVDESTAAAFGYGVAAPGRRILTCDLGGGTIDLSLVRLPDELDLAGGALTATVIAKASQILGGQDIDAWLLDRILARLQVARGAAEPEREALLAAAEQTKIALSTAASATFEARLGDEQLRCEVSRDELEEALIARDFLARLQASIDTILRQAERKGVGKSDIEHVLLVGGTSQIPAVRRAIQQNFGAHRVDCQHVFTAAARGAARLGLGTAIRDFLYHSYAIRGWNHVGRRHEYDLVVPALSPYPFERPVVREYAASTPQQTAMELVIGEIEHGDLARPEVILEDHRVRVINAASTEHRYVLVDADRAVPLGKATVVRLDPPGHPGINRVRVTFDVDTNRRLRLTVFDLQTQQFLVRDQAVATLT